MRIVLFCENHYSFSILQPICDEALKDEANTVLWYIHEPNISHVPLLEDMPWTYDMQRVYDFSPEAIFVPGNIVPYYLPGVKIQIFHGYAAEKKGHYVMRKYFDLYLTQGPMFTQGFRKLEAKYKNFEVCETGWSKKDLFCGGNELFKAKREELLERCQRSKIVLYAPTFSPKLTSLTSIEGELELLVTSRDVLMVIKLHPLTSAELVAQYEAFAQRHSDCVVFASNDELLCYEMISDIMISDTSSVVYEFLLLRKPVITLRSISSDILWDNITSPEELLPAFDKVNSDKESMEKIYDRVAERFDPYNDGLSSRRMLEAVADYIARHGVPTRRRLNLWRRYTSIKRFGKIK